MRRWLMGCLGCLGLAVALGGLGCARGAEPAPVSVDQRPDGRPSSAAAGGATGEGEAPERVRFEPVVPVSAVTVGVLPASLVLPDEHRMTLGPPLEGRIAAWRVEVGSPVVPGTALADLDVLGIPDLEAALVEAGQLVAARTKTLEAERRAAGQGLSSASDVMAYEVGVAEARARRDALKAQIDARKRTVGEGWTWTSDVQGVVERVACTRGQVARPDSGCLTVVDAAKVVVRVHVPETWLGRWHGPINGELVMSGDDASIALQEVRRAPRLDEGSRTLAVDFVAMGTAKGDTSPLTPGRSGRVALRAALAGLAVPEAALTRLDGRDVVFTPAGEGAVPVPVERLGRDGERIVVRVQGPAPGEVATRGLFLLKSRHVLGEGAP